MKEACARHRGESSGVPEVSYGQVWIEYHLVRFESATNEDNQSEKRERGVPIDGPPRTRMISLDEPPSSETGSTKHGLSNAEQMAFPPEPPDITVISGDDFGVSVVWALVLGRRSKVLLLPRVASDCGLGFAGWTGRSNTDELGLSSGQLPCIPG
jgi:hypothetical protein